MSAPKNNIQIDQPRLWKDRVDEPKLRAFARAFKDAYTEFDEDRYVSAVLDDGYLNRELKDRLTLLARHLKAVLPADYRRAVKILREVAPQVGGWGNWSLTAYVELFGLDQFDLSVKTLKYLTQFGTAEFAIRPFVNARPRDMLAELSSWTSDPNEHIRRLAAEGSRPRGVWVTHIEQFRKDPRPVIKLLEKLKADKSDYVRRAVANSLNDMSKDHPDLVVATARRWQKDENRHTDWIIRHACRSLLKTGHPEVFPLFGFSYPAKVSISDFAVRPKRVRIGDSLSFTFKIISKTAKEQRLAIDYIIHYLKADGSHSPKVFKLTAKSLPPKAELTLTGSQSFRQRSTRRHFPGPHRLELQINGTRTGSIEFSLIK